MTNDLAKQGRDMVQALISDAKTFDDKHKAFMAWLRWQELETRRKRAGMGAGFEEQGGDDDGGTD